MVLLGTLVAAGKRTEKTMQSKNRSGEESSDSERQEGIERVLRHRIEIEKAKMNNHGCPPARISRPFSKPYVSNASLRLLLS